MKQDEKRRVQRKPFKTYMKTMIKKCATLAEEGKKDEVLALLPAVYKAIDNAAKRHLLHKNTAARRKAKMANLAVK